MTVLKETLFSFTKDELFYLKIALADYSVHLSESHLFHMRDEVNALFDQLKSVEVL